MNILIYHGKHGDEYWLADTPERFRAAMRKLFTMLDEDGCYEGENVEQARSGDHRFICHLLQSRKDCEYEGWDLEEVSDPCI